MKILPAKGKARLPLAAALGDTAALLLPGVGEASRTLVPALDAKLSATPVTAVELRDDRL